ncbi:hypothetical protein ACXR0O_25575 [Verrucomicrobiota bacterium sgz303538]
MASRRKIIGVCTTAAMSALLIFGSAGLGSYYAACAAAQTYVAGASDGPWIRAKTGFVIDLNVSDSPGVLAPRWVFRFQNPRSGGESKRIYVPLSADRALSYTTVLDPEPLIGVRP